VIYVGFTFLVMGVLLVLVGLVEKLDRTNTPSYVHTPKYQRNEAELAFVLLVVGAALVLLEVFA
jgi:hypothetical protein